MKHEWKKSEKSVYLPKASPAFITIPEYQFFTIEGAGNPNDAAFAEYIGVLYALSYAVKMSPKKGIAPHGYYDYTVYPLEGIWDITDEAKKHFNGKLNKNDLVFKLMIRQPSFVDKAYANQILEYTNANKPHDLLSKIHFESITDDVCVQMMHIGSYDTEPASFRLMEDFTHAQNRTRKSMLHREIYISDARKVAPEKLKTVLRFQVK